MFYVPIIEKNVGCFHVLIVESPPQLQHEVKIFYKLLLLWLSYLSRGVWLFSVHYFSPSTRS